MDIEPVNPPDPPQGGYPGQKIGLLNALTKTIYLASQKLYHTHLLDVK